MFAWLFGVESLQPYPFQTDVLGTHILSTDIFFSFFFCHSLWVVVLGLAIWGEAALHLSHPLGFCLGFILVGELQLNQMSFDPLPSLPRNTLWELHLESSP